MKIFKKNRFHTVSQFFFNFSPRKKLYISDIFKKNNCFEFELVVEKKIKLKRIDKPKLRKKKKRKEGSKNLLP